MMSWDDINFLRSLSNTKGKKTASVAKRILSNFGLKKNQPHNIKLYLSFVLRNCVCVRVHMQAGGYTESWACSGLMSLVVREGTYKEQKISDA